MTPASLSALCERHGVTVEVLAPVRGAKLSPAATLALGEILTVELAAGTSLRQLEVITGVTAETLARCADKLGLARPLPTQSRAIRCRTCPKPIRRRGSQCQACHVAALVARRPPPPPVSETRRKLPLVEGHLLPGGGGGRAGDGQHPLAECARYDDCLEAYARAHREGGASCARGCAWWEAAPTLRATAYMSPDGADRGALVGNGQRGVR